MKIFFFSLLILSLVFCLIIIKYQSNYISNDIGKAGELIDESEYEFKSADIIINKNEWTVQYNIAQYSSIIVEQEDGSTLVEALFFHDISTDFNYIRNNVKCYVSNTLTKDKSLYEPFEILAIDSEASIWVIKCKIDKKVEHLNLNVAIIDNEKFKINQNTTLVKWQSPSFFDKSVPKKKQIAHCVHTIYAMSEELFESLVEWILIQRKLNISKIKLYFYKADNLDYYTEKLKKHYNADFVEVVAYKNNLKDYCNPKANVNLEKYLTTEESCTKSFSTHFSKVHQKHEKINTNDCYLNFKHEYEYVSNYDFDEFIFPRSSQSDEMSALFDSFETNSNSSCKLKNDYKNPQYDMYRYASNLQAKLGGNTVALLQFDNSWMLLDFRILLDKILKHETGTQTPFQNSNEIMMKNVKKAILAIDCLNQTIHMNGFYNTKWNNAYSIRKYDRLGKSIYVTNNTQTINVHEADNISPNTVFAKVPPNLGYVSHFRIHQVYNSESFEQLHFDLEYYLFFVNLKKNNKIFF